jgi:hypothetical protein
MVAAVGVSDSEWSLLMTFCAHDLPFQSFRGALSLSTKIIPEGHKMWQPGFWASHRQYSNYGGYPRGQVSRETSLQHCF